MTRVLVPSGALGLGYDRSALAAGIANAPDIIAIDGGSTDSGPSYLGRGVSKYSTGSTRAEWRDLMRARAKAGVPLVIGTAGTCGTDSAVDWLYQITCEIASQTGQHLKIARLYSSQPPDFIASTFVAGGLAPLPAAPEVTAHEIGTSSNIVALAGAEQVQAALQTGADIIIGGRTTDTAIIAALPLMNGDHPGAAWHGAKVGECGAMATTLPRSGVIQIDFDASGFTLTPMAAEASATPYTVSAHMLYENSDPFVLYEPGGHLDVTEATYTALDPRRVRVEGSRWVPGPYTVKLEAARITGYQVVSFTILRERRYVENVRQWAADVAAKCREQVGRELGISAQEFQIELRLIGIDAALGPLENHGSIPHEVGILAIATAQRSEIAGEIGKMLNPYLLHHPLTQDEPMPTFAFPFSPAEIPRGAVYEFCLNHVMALKDPMQAFRLVVAEVGNG